MIGVLLMFEDVFRERLLQRAEGALATQPDEMGRTMWGAHVDEDAARLGEWRATWTGLVRP